MYRSLFPWFQHDMVKETGRERWLLEKAVGPLRIERLEYRIASLIIGPQKRYYSDDVQQLLRGLEKTVQEVLLRGQIEKQI